MARTRPGSQNQRFKEEQRGVRMYKQLHNILHSFIIKYRSYLLVTMLRTSSQVFRSRTSQRYDSRVVVDN